MKSPGINRGFFLNITNKENKSMDWTQIGFAVLLGAMIIFMYPRVKHSMENSPKAENGDWTSALLPILAVVGFVILLIMLV